MYTASFGEVNERRVRSLLSKVTKENYLRIAAQIAAIEVSSLENLEAMGRMVVNKALNEPLYCRLYCCLIREVDCLRDNDIATFSRTVLQCFRQIFLDKLVAVVVADHSASSFETQPGGFTSLCLDEWERGMLITGGKFAGCLFVEGVASADFLKQILRCLMRRHARDDPIIPRVGEVGDSVLPKCALMNGDPTISQPRHGDSVLDFQSRLADELCVTPCSLHLIGADGTILPSALQLEDLEAGVVLQVAIQALPAKNELVESLLNAVEVLVECSSVSVLTEAQFAPLTSPLTKAVDPTGDGDGHVDATARTVLVAECATYLHDVLESQTAEGHALSCRVRFLIENTLQHIAAWQS